MTPLIIGSMDVDAELAAARARIARTIRRVAHFPARSQGQKRRYAKLASGGGGGWRDPIKGQIYLVTSSSSWIET